jgi:hypothetical protein
MAFELVRCISRLLLSAQQGEVASVFKMVSGRRRMSEFHFMPERQASYAPTISFYAPTHITCGVGH